MKAFLFALFFLSFAYSSVVKPVPVDSASVEIEGNAAYVTVEGFLPNGCYSAAKILFEKNRRALIRAQAVSKVEGTICEEIIRFYKITTLLGPLPQGVHTLLLQEGTVWERELEFEIKDQSASKALNMSSRVLERRKAFFLAAPSLRSSKI